MTVTFEPTIKQDAVFNLFDDKETTEILFGGGVGSAKSYLLASLCILKSFEKPGIRIGLARNELTTLKKTTVVTFMEVLSNWGMHPKQHYNYNSIEGSIKFNNNSEIVFSELRYLPSDPNYTRLGGLLLTFAVIDEAGECDAKGKEIYQTRVGRWKNNEYKVKPILIMTCNPSRNFLYDDFYEANKENRMPKHRAFINATVYDNPYIPQSYIDNLKQTLSFSEVQRLLNGDWEYDGDPNNLLDFETIKMCYVDIPETTGVKYLSCDIAFTSDNCVLMVWDGLTVEKIINVTKNENVEHKIIETAKEFGVPQNRIVFDSDGVGKYLTQSLRLAKPIVNNAKPLNKENYINLKTQLYFKLCELINKNIVKINDTAFKKEVEQELMAIKHKPKETSEGKIEMNSKAEVKRIIGRSPDFSDTMAYRMLFELKSIPKRSFIIK